MAMHVNNEIGTDANTGFIGMIMKNQSQNTPFVTVDSDTIRANAPQAISMIKKRLNVGCKTQSVLDIITAGIGLKDYNTIKGLKYNKDFYQAQANLGNHTNPVINTIDLGFFDKTCEAIGALKLTLKDCTHRLEWTLLLNGEVTQHTVNTHIKPMAGGTGLTLEIQATDDDAIIEALHCVISDIGSGEGDGDSMSYDGYEYHYETFDGQQSDSNEPESNTAYCKIYPDDEALPNEDGTCSLCQSYMNEAGECLGVKHEFTPMWSIVDAQGTIVSDEACLELDFTNAGNRETAQRVEDVSFVQEWEGVLYLLKELNPNDLPDDLEITVVGIDAISEQIAIEVSLKQIIQNNSGHLKDSPYTWFELMDSK
ncbi:hypothetical protein VCHA53O466_140010 [Vibrio chagasii]|nr:hypothetical protein VCHA53O466_140010 [Vibrio chagasii]